VSPETARHDFKAAFAMPNAAAAVQKKKKKKLRRRRRTLREFKRM